MSPLQCLKTEPTNQNGKLALWPVVPKELVDLFESLAEAVFIDSGESNAVLWKVFYPFLKDVLDKICLDPRTITQKAELQIPRFPFQASLGY
ncbi:hypothetical protein DAPPUDRAFT_337204 [Daphnia pulex]|uniref:RNase III domain-containing protein n=1 Tax=Daphnia pulex TaxID=6669 RepID=E9I181_DAPPU|nr:hypothetical protein DAPPUDRAFT_337204 [Daphnia pulex]|eukprot:EFX62249.1 hypothetical protein DAPPUDRAFT_337204 [Daphnia pulex]